MKKTFKLKDISGGFSVPEDQRGSWAHPKNIPTIRNTQDCGISFFGDDLVRVSGMDLTIASEYRTWGDIAIIAGAGLGIGIFIGVPIGLLYGMLQRP